MTRYASTTDLTRHGLPSGALTGVPTATQEAALDANSALADTYLAQRFTLPLSAWGAAIARAVATMTAYDLMTTRGYKPDAGADEILRLRYEDTMRWWRDVAASRVTPQGVTDATPSDDSEQDGTFVVTNTRRNWRRR